MNYPYTQKQISEICGVCLKTVHNWQKHKTIPLWALEKLGYKIITTNKE